jgi:hypothetical protein
MRCRTARRWITRDLAGELTPGRVERLGRHVERCEACRREQVAYAALDRALAALPMTATVPARLEGDTLRRARLAAAEDAHEDGQRPRPWVLVMVPAAAAAAAAVILTVAPAPSPSGAGPAPARRLAGAPPQVAERAQPRSTPPAPVHRRRAAPVTPEPPPELAARPDLFVNLPLLRNMEKLQHYEAIQTTTLDGQQEDRSSG